VFFILGFSIVTAINGISGQGGKNINIKPDEAFFMGFLALSSVSGLLSIWIPLGPKILLFIVLLAALLYLINFRQIKISLKDIIRNFSSLSKWEMLFLLFIVIFILTYVSNKITLGDTESYHAQSIQWVRKYAVVPGLGNIHGRLAFNSMFLVISGLFAFQIKNVLIFPLNGICYLVVIIKLFFLYKKENTPGTRWKALFYILTLLISLLIMIPDLNSPSTDIICATLIIYSFSILMDHGEKNGQLNYIQIILLNLAVLSCITFKISSLFLILSLLFILKKEVVKKICISFIIGILVFSSFLIRNYYLSGYLIYPFPRIDLFNVDWKIPVDDVLSMKLEIESWAKISTLPSSDVINMKVSEWIVPWFKSLNFNNKMILTVNIFSVVSLIVMLLKKDIFLASIQLIILINLIFWFLRAPDPRFAYGFLFLGFSLNCAYLLKHFDKPAVDGIFKFIRIGLACFLILIICRRIMFPLNTLKNTSLWILPAPFGTVETKDHFAGFHYRVPVPEGGCFNVEIPCTPYPLTDIILRGKDLQEGFRFVKQNP
jgi:hypothetical protein